MKLYRALAVELRAAGTEVVFALMGDGNLDLLAACADAGIRVVRGRHENQVVAMADGYGRHTGRPGVASVTHGPGLTNAITALACASANGSHLVVLVGDTSTDDPGHVQNLDQERLVVATGVWSVRPLDARTAVGAVRSALTGPGPTTVHLPVDVQHQSTEPLVVDHRAAGRSCSPRRPLPVPCVEDAVAVLQGSQRPFVLAGRGSIDDEGPAAIARLADVLGAPIGTSLLAKGLLPDHPRQLGVVGGIGHDDARRRLARADVVVAAGASLNRFTTDGGRLIAPDATVVQIDIDRASFGRHTPAAIGLHGHVAPTVDAIAARLEPRPAEDCALRRSPGAVLGALRSVLPPDPVVVIDGGHFNVAAATDLDVRDPRDFLWAADLGTVGQGLGMAIGAAVGSDRRITLVCGDGGFMMCSSELDTAVREQVDLLVVVLDDGAYGQEVHVLDGKGHPTELARFDTPDLAAMARAVGARGVGIDPARPDTFLALRGALAEPGPVVAHARIDPFPPNRTIAPYLAALASAGRCA